MSDSLYTGRYAARSLGGGDVSWAVRDELGGLSVVVGDRLGREYGTLYRDRGMLEWTADSALEAYLGGIQVHGPLTECKKQVRRLHGKETT